MTLEKILRYIHLGPEEKKDLKMVLGVGLLVGYILLRTQGVPEQKQTYHGTYRGMELNYTK